MYTITAVYKFTPITPSAIETVRSELTKVGESLDMCGLFLIATEGINGTVAAPTETQLQQFKDELEKRFGELIFKDSTSDEKPFKRWFVKIRDSIVNIGKDDIHPDGKNNHLSPAEWNDMMKSDDVVVLDTRNDYETEIGVFKGAIDPQLKTFGEFPDYVKNCGIPKDKKVLMYCTGGIRCEKASIEMQKQGYENVYQLDGGILAYFKEFPNELFDGECFVFDHRASVNQELRPSERYRLCPHCGDPGDIPVFCSRCHTEATICMRCSLKAPQADTCSKNCAHIVGRGKAVQR